MVTTETHLCLHAERYPVRFRTLEGTSGRVLCKDHGLSEEFEARRVRKYDERSMAEDRMGCI